MCSFWQNGWVNAKWIFISSDPEKTNITLSMSDCELFLQTLQANRLGSPNSKGRLHFRLYLKPKKGNLFPVVIFIRHCI